MNDLPFETAAPSSATSTPPPAVPAAALRPARGPWIGVALAGVLAVGSAVLAWKADQRVATLEQELVRRQQDSSAQSAEARMLAKQAQQGMTDATAKVALLEARVAETATQRGQLEDLIQSLSRSRDENVLGDIEQAVRVALQQTAITGSAEPLVATLKQADERLARYSQPRLEGVRRAIARDLDRVKATNVTDISSLGIKLDEAVRMIDDLPLVAAVEARSRETAARVGAGSSARAMAAAVPTASAAATSASAPNGAFWPTRVNEVVSDVAGRVWDEARSLIRVTRIDAPEAMLIAPEQAYFLKENLKLRLLNARLALLSRQFETAQSDLQVAQGSLDRFFDRGNKRTALAADLVKQVAAQARHVGVPRPDDTLAALTAASAGR
ncbi:MAG TPA: uroporphyrinogen-III C-methyltransferase [Burkholderiaceae bacterium]|nr:uroporphyrinogen-III C-methyltransferase [Burkholderiaceae bacterium]